MTLAARLNAQPHRPVALSKIRILCHSGNRAGLHIKSTLDNTYKLDYKVDEDISFTDEDLIAIRNNSGTPCEITVRAIQLKDGRRALLSPSRQCTFWLMDPEMTAIHVERTITLGVDETCMLRTNWWEGRSGPGAVFPV